MYYFLGGIWTGPVTLKCTTRGNIQFKYEGGYNKANPQEYKDTNKHEPKRDGTELSLRFHATSIQSMHKIDTSAADFSPDSDRDPNRPPQRYHCFMEIVTKDSKIITCAEHLAQKKLDKFYAEFQSFVIKHAAQSLPAFINANKVNNDQSISKEEGTTTTPITRKVENVDEPSLDSIRQWEQEFNPILDYQRMGALGKDSQWRISLMNRNFSAIPTYPRQFMVPKIIPDDHLTKMLHKRSKGRLPVLSYFVKTSKVTVSRCAQPMLGVNLQRKPFRKDRKLLDSILSTNQHNTRLLVMDLRPHLNATANKLFRGAGSENPALYPNCDIKFYDIPNIHVVRQGYEKLKDIVNHKLMNASYEQVEKWLNYIKLIMHASSEALQAMFVDKQSVLVHCSDGWDRTSQVCALIGICADPFYRTLRGLMVLIEREWIQFGHMFHKRTGRSYSKKDSDRSPIFHQFMECIYNLMIQNPTAFEYTEDYLLEILDALHEHRFREFLFNSQKERCEEATYATYPSLWDHLQGYQSRFMNQKYKVFPRVIFPDVRPLGTTLWRGFWFRYVPRHYNTYDFDAPLQEMRGTSSGTSAQYHDEQGVGPTVAFSLRSPGDPATLLSAEAYREKIHALTTQLNFAQDELRVYRETDPKKVEL